MGPGKKGKKTKKKAKRGKMSKLSQVSLKDNVQKDGHSGQKNTIKAGGSTAYSKMGTGVECIPLRLL